MRIIVTGAGGFIGGFLVAALADRGDVVEAWTRNGSRAWGTSIENRVVDVTDAECVAEAVERFAPDTVVHLAARSLPAPSWEEPGETYRVNIGGAVNILEAARLQTSPPRVLLAGTSAEYAEPRDGNPLREDALIEPNSPYAGSKQAAAQLGDMYGRRYGLPVIGFRPFYLIGPGKIGDVCSDFARRVVGIEHGAVPTLRVGDITVVRDMIDVRDGVRGVLRLIDAGCAGETYNICGGHAVRLYDILQTLRALASVPITVEHDPALLRPLEQKVKIGDPAKLRALDWTPKLALGDTLEEILAFWRAAKTTCD